MSVSVLLRVCGGEYMWKYLSCLSRVLKRMGRCVCRISNKGVGFMMKLLFFLLRLLVTQSMLML